MFMFVVFNFQTKNHTVRAGKLEEFDIHTEYDRYRPKS